MKGLIIAAVAALGLAGCIAVPVGGGPYYGGGPSYYYPAPAVGFVGVYRGGGYYRHGYGRW